MKHSATPWVQNSVGNMIKSNDLIIAVTGSDKTTFNTDVNNAARIVQCVNEYDGLIEKIKMLRDALEKIVEMNLQNAKDKYGDESMANGWSCVTVAREALSNSVIIE